MNIYEVRKYHHQTLIAVESNVEGDEAAQAFAVAWVKLEPGANAALLRVTGRVMQQAVWRTRQKKSRAVERPAFAVDLISRVSVTKVTSA